MGKSKNLIGKRFGKLVVIEKMDYKINNSIIWKCKCDCNSNNSITYVPTNILNSGRKKSCGCLTHTERFDDLTNKKFGKLLVLYNTGKNDGHRCRIWHCRCSCENHTEIDVSSYNLKSGKTKSCGCLQKEEASKLGEKMLQIC